MGNIQELEKQLAAKAEEREKSFKPWQKTSSLNTKGKLTESQFRKKNRSAYASAVFYEKFWVTGNTITVLKWNISFWAGRNYKFSSDKLSFDRNKTEVSQENGYSFEHNLISSGAYGRDKEMSVNKFMQLWEYGYFVVQELDNVHKNCGTAVGLD
jgi:hypothetical protein